VQHKQKLDFLIVVIFRKNTTENTLKIIFLKKFTKKVLLLFFALNFFIKDFPLYKVFIIANICNKYF
jgi:hypothetical protein